MTDFPFDLCVICVRTERCVIPYLSSILFFLFFIYFSVRLTMLNGRYQMLIDMQTDGLEPLYNVTWDYRFRYNYDERFDVTRVFCFCWRFISWLASVAYMVHGNVVICTICWHQLCLFFYEGI